MKSYITEKTIRQFVKDVSNRQHVMSGAVIAASAAQAVALGEACMQISLDHQVDTLDWQDIMARIEHLAHVRQSLLEWSDQDARTIAEYSPTSSELDNDLPTLQILYDSAAEIARLSITAIIILQNFRPLALKRLQEDLEIVVYLLIGTARASLSMLHANFTYQPNPHFLAQYRPVAAELKMQIDQITLVK